MAIAFFQLDTVNGRKPEKLAPSEMGDQQTKSGPHEPNGGAGHHWKN